MTNQRTSLAAASVGRLRDTVFGLQGNADSSQALQEVCDAVRELVDARVVVVSLVEDEGLRAVAFSGDPGGHSIVGRLLGMTQWERMVEESQRWGLLRFCRDARPYGIKGDYPTLDDGRLVAGDAEHWGSLDVLIAPMWSPLGDLVGAVTLDAAPGAELPDQLRCTILEMFTAQAGAAVHHRRLAERAAVDHLALRLSEERFRLAFDNAPIAMTEFSGRDDGLVVTRMNRAAARLLGVASARSSGRRVDELMPVVEGEPLEAVLSVLREGDVHGVDREVRLARADGSDFWAAVQAEALPDLGGRLTILCQLRDITVSRASALRLSQQATHDALTGLPNRGVVFDRLAWVVRAAADTGRPGACLFCDLDNFKLVNDEHGHLVGDEVLAELASRLQTVVRNDDTAGRFGGDEFVVVVYPMSLETAKALADRISQVLSAPISRGPSNLRIQVSIGIAPITGAFDAAEVIRRADAAMYAARSRRHRAATFIVDTD